MTTTRSRPRKAGIQVLSDDPRGVLRSVLQQNADPLRVWRRDKAGLDDHNAAVPGEVRADDPIWLVLDAVAQRLTDRYEAIVGVRPDGQATTDDADLLLGQIRRLGQSFGLDIDIDPLPRRVLTPSQIWTSPESSEGGEYLEDQPIITSYATFRGRWRWSGGVSADDVADDGILKRKK